jgi:hypothetical protein
MSHEDAERRSYVYGRTSALALARSYPGRAIQHADNYEYLAEEN